ncbi:MAG: peptidoglycan-binding domain-containing protein [Cyanobacteria bacterium J06598_3]
MATLAALGNAALAQTSLAQTASAQAVAQAPAAAETAYPTLTANSTGESVSRLQATLKLLGFYRGSVDGTYTQATQDAVAQFQAATGITADGITGPSTWRKLLPKPEEVTNVAPVAITPAGSAATIPPAPTQPAAPQPTAPQPATSQPAPQPAAVPSGPPILRPNAEGGAVAQLQRELQALNYYSGDIDGGYGEQTQAAVMAFQRDQQLEVDAIVGPSTWDALSRALAQ